MVGVVIRADAAAVLGNQILAVGVGDFYYPVCSIFLHDLREGPICVDEETRLVPVNDCGPPDAVVVLLVPQRVTAVGPRHVRCDEAVFKVPAVTCQFRGVGAGEGVAVGVVNIAGDDTTYYSVSSIGYTF